MAGASFALTAATVLAANRVLSVSGLASGRHEGFQFVLLRLWAFRLHSHHPIAHHASVFQKSLLR